MGRDDKFRLLRNDEQWKKPRGWIIDQGQAASSELQAIFFLVNKSKLALIECRHQA